MRKLIVIADWAKDSLTCQEIRTSVQGYLKDAHFSNISFIASTPSTIHTSFLIGQMVHTEERYGHPRETVIFQNTDPRLYTTKGLPKADGAKPLIIRLKNGLYLCGPNAGYDFSLIKKKIEQVFTYTGENEEGQFHSRDIYSRISAYLMDELEDNLELDELGLGVIPELRGKHITHIDNFGNIKTTIRKSDFKGKYEFGDMVTIKINNVKKKARYVSNLFGGRQGDLVIYPGSSGVEDDRYLEVTIWRHFTEKNPTTGLHEFSYPRPGMEIEIG